MKLNWYNWCQEQATTYACIDNGKAVEDGFLWKIAMSLSNRKRNDKKTQVCCTSMKTLFTDLKAKYLKFKETLSFLLEQICSSSNVCGKPKWI